MAARGTLLFNAKILMQKVKHLLFGVDALAFTASRRRVLFFIQNRIHF
jgi:hypothetical protein